MKKKISIALAALAGIAVPAAASIIAVFGDVALVAAPAAVTLNASENDFILQAFDERQCFQLMANLQTDQGAIAAGTWVSSHFVHADPTAGNALLLQGRAQFDHDILGVMSTTALLDASDAVCGNPGTVYPTGTEANRQLEPAPQADAYVLFGPRTLGVRMEVPVDSYSDQIRVITRCCPDGMVCD